MMTALTNTKPNMTYAQAFGYLAECVRFYEPKSVVTAEARVSRDAWSRFWKMLHDERRFRTLPRVPVHFCWTSSMTVADVLRRFELDP